MRRSDITAELAKLSKAEVIDITSCLLDLCAYSLSPSFTDANQKDSTENLYYWGWRDSRRALLEIALEYRHDKLYEQLLHNDI